ncbi:adenylate/guanylate cyclase domain-containing protein [Aquibium sp. LZ166]|uniref:Adenylate/guanylate cyclase domain-containing protein n=1 Tax=Aquibium pacificus TaxID=3153579 RepID=A0ABV3SJW2_9HYPH
MNLADSGAKGSGARVPTAGDAIASRVYVVLFADAVDFSKRTHRDELSASQAMHAAFGLIEREVDRCGGRILNRTGDGVVAAFESAVTGTRCAIEIQKRFEDIRREKSGESFEFRIGMSMGEIIEIDGNAFGDSINIAARIERLTPAGSVWMSSTLYEAVRSRSEFGFEYVGPFSLKNIAEPADVYRVYDGSAAVTLRPANRERLGEAAIAGREYPAPGKKPSIAVLPFQNQSGDGEHDFFADGVTEDIIRNLTRFRGLNVIARGSSFAFRGSALPLSELGMQIGARYIVRGSIRPAGSRVRVSVALDDTQLQHSVWSERYDKPLEDIFAIQDEITELAVAAMAVRVEAAERERLTALPPRSIDAYGLVLRGQAKTLEFTAQANGEALQLYRRALILAPDYARALAALSRAHSLNWRYGWGEDPRAGLDLATRYAMDAVAADPNDARGHGELGFVQLYRHEHSRSIASYERALLINPNDANIIAEYADVLTHSGRAGDALAHFDRAMRLNPLYPDQYLWDRAGALMLLRRFEEAIQQIHAMVNPAQGRRILAVCYAHLGQLEAAEREAALIRAEHPGFSVDEWARVIPEQTGEGMRLFVSGLRLAGL